MKAVAAGALAASSDEIVVTAKKRSENVRSVLKQVAVASQAQLAVACVTRITDLQTVFPTVTATSQAQNSKAPGIRRMAPSPIRSACRRRRGLSWMIYRKPLRPPWPTDVERVEVFARPQATLSKVGLTHDDWPLATHYRCCTTRFAGRTGRGADQ
ncbi:hypothetical protein EP837_01915 [Sphingobium sp. EP60837]|nr:hypothetical protein EP837_01915 [Sphingobium sp. EP60837]